MQVSQLFGQQKLFERLNPLLQTVQFPLVQVKQFKGQQYPEFKV